MDYTDNAVTSAAQNSFTMAIRSAGRPSESMACIHAIFFSGTHRGTAQEFKLLTRRSATRGESPLQYTQLLPPRSAIHSMLAFAVVRLNDSGPCARLQGSRGVKVVTDLNAD